MTVVPLSARHPIRNFICSNDTMNQWFWDIALTYQSIGAARTYVALDDDGKIMGFYSLCNAAFDRAEAPGRRHGLPAMIPAILLARLAVDEQFERQGVGFALVADAMLTAEEQARHSACMFLTVDPIDEGARAFYAKAGFISLRGASVMARPVKVPV
ncbi:MAG: GNAT family N-acetyltransferase [Rhizobiaceae bacterium]